MGRAQASILSKVRGPTACVQQETKAALRARSFPRYDSDELDGPANGCQAGFGLAG